jgi:hypothetical protein
VGLARVGNISNISRVCIGNCVLDGLETTVGKLNMVLSVGGITIASLVLSKLDVVAVGILGINTVSVLVLGRSRFISGLIVSTATMGSESPTKSATTRSKPDAKSDIAGSDSTTKSAT